MSAKVEVTIEIPQWRLWVAHIAMSVCAVVAVDLDACAERIADWVIAGACVK